MSIIMNKFYKHIAFLAFAPLVFLAHCSDATTARKVDPILLSGETAKFKELVQDLDSPKGLISCTLKNIIGEPGSVIVIKNDQNSTSTCVDRSDFHNYFIFDENQSLFVLQTDPLIFLYIESREFNFHLTSEYNQFKANPSLSPDDKIKNSQTHYRVVGDYDVALTFTPNEMRYSDRGANDGRIQDRNSATYLDYWRLLSASKEAIVYIPDEFTETRLFTDLYCQVQKGNTRKVYTPESSLTLSDLPDWFRSPTDDRFDQACYDAQRNDRSTIRPWYELRSDMSSKIKHFISFGKDLVINGDLLGAADINFADRLGLTRPYAFFLSTALGSTSDAAEANNQDYLSRRHGFGIQLRGDVDFLLEEAIALGLPGYEEAFSPVKVLSAINEGSTIRVNWSQSTDAQVLHYATNANETQATIDAKPDTDFTVIKNVTAANETTFTIAAADGTCTNGETKKGCAHWFRVKGLSTTPQSTVAVAPAEAGSGNIIFTEIMWAGTQTPEGSEALDDFIEIKNVSTTTIYNLATLDFYHAKFDGTCQTTAIMFGPNTTSEDRPALDGVIYPGEYVTIFRRDDYIYTQMSTAIKDRSFVRSFYSSDRSYSGLTDSFNLCLGTGLNGTLPETTISNIIREDGGGDPQDDKGADGSVDKSMVLNSSDTWITSTTDTGWPEGGKNLATPGYAATGEK